MTGVKITWDLATPVVVGSYPLHLDALVGYAVAQEGMQSDLASWDINAKLDLPIETETRDGLTCLKASAVIPAEPGEHAMRFWTRKTDPFDYAARVAEGLIDMRTKLPLKPYAIKVDTARGMFKQMFKFYPVRSVSRLQAWCVGDLDRLAELLVPEAGFINYIGAKGRMGHGRVIACDIQEDDEAFSQWENRVLPWQKEGFVEVEAAASMPYWDPSNRTRAWINPDLYN